MSFKTVDPNSPPPGQPPQQQAQLPPHPLDADPLDTQSVDVYSPGFDPFPQTQSIGELPNEGGPAGSNPAGSPAGTPPPSREQELAQLAEDYGVDASQLSQFPDAASARAAINLLVNRYANLGLDATLNPQPHANTPPANVPPQGDNAHATVQQTIAALDLEGEDLSPKVLAAIQALHAAGQASTTELAGIKQEIQGFKQQQAQLSQQQRQSEAISFLDTLDDPRYGKGPLTSRSAAERININRIFQLADAIAIGYERAGQTPPALKTLLRQAVLQDVPLQPQQRQTARAPQPSQTSAPVPVQTFEHLAIPANPQVTPQTGDIRLGQYHNNPDFMRSVRAIAGRVR